MRTRGVYVGLGSNLDEPATQLGTALNALARVPETTLVRVSSLYRTPPWGVVAQPDFVNAVAEIDTGLAPDQLMRELLALERSFGRERGGTRWGPRRLDLDLLLFGETVLDVPGCHVPHPHLHERAFVLVPLAELAFDAVVPGRGVVRDLLAALPPDEVHEVRALAPALEPATFRGK